MFLVRFLKAAWLVATAAFVLLVLFLYLTRGYPCPRCGKRTRSLGGCGCDQQEGPPCSD